MDEAISVPNYTRKQAVSLICTCYNQFGSNLNVEVLHKSILEDSVGELTESWNVGLFRFLDEIIYLFRLLEWFSTAAGAKDNSLRAQMILCHQIERNLLAVRVLGASGLDGSARQNLRCLYEMCHALCRCLVDSEFAKEFSGQPTLKSANEFWHRFMAKQRTEKFLKAYNETTANKCSLVLGNEFDEAYSVLGVGAHPNYLGWMLDWKAELSDPVGMESMFSFGAHRSSEFVLATACHLSLATLNFASCRIANISGPLGLLDHNPIFRHYGGDIEALNGFSKTAGLMFLMLAKWTNRNKPHFDPQVHY